MGEIHARPLMDQHTAEETRELAFIDLVNFINNVNKDDLTSIALFKSECAKVLGTRVYPQYFVVDEYEDLKFADFVIRSQTSVTDFINQNFESLSIQNSLDHGSSCKMESEECQEIGDGKLLVVALEKVEHLVKCLSNFDSSMRYKLLGGWGRRSLINDIRTWMRKSKRSLYEAAINCQSLNVEEVIQSTIAPLFRVIMNMLLSADTNSNADESVILDLMEKESLKYLLLTDPVMLSVLRDLLITLESRKFFSYNNTTSQRILLESMIANRDVYSRSLPVLALTILHYELRIASTGHPTNLRVVPVIQSMHAKDYIFQVFAAFAGQ